MNLLRDFVNQHKPKSTHGIFSDFLEHIPRGEGCAYDLCCGSGTLTQSLSERGYLAVGVDLADQFLGKEAQAGNFVLADVNHLPFHNQSADYVCSVDSLQYFHDPQATLQEMIRLVKPNGYLIISTQNNFNLAGVKKWLIKRLTGRDWSPWLLHPIENHITYPWLVARLQEAGMEIEFVRGKQFLTAWVSLLPAVVRNWSPTGKSWHSLASIAARLSFPRWIETSFLARFAMIVLIKAKQTSVPNA